MHPVQEGQIEAFGLLERGEVPIPVEQGKRVPGQLVSVFFPGCVDGVVVGPPLGDQDRHPDLSRTLCQVVGVEQPEEALPTGPSNSTHSRSEVES